MQRKLPDLKEVITTIILQDYEQEKPWYISAINYFHQWDHPAVTELKKFSDNLPDNPSLFDLLKLSKLCERREIVEDQLVNTLFDHLYEQLKIVYKDQEFILSFEGASFIFLENKIFDDDQNIKMLCQDTVMFPKYFQYLNELSKGWALTKEYFDMMLSMDEFKKPHGRYLPKIMITHYWPSYVYLMRGKPIDEETLRVIYAALANSSLYESDSDVEPNTLFSAIPDFIYELRQSNLLIPEILQYVFKDCAFPHQAEMKINFLIELNKGYPIIEDQLMLGLLKEDNLNLHDTHITYYARVICSVRMAQLLFSAFNSEGSVFSQVPREILGRIIFSDPGFPTLNDKYCNAFTLFRPKKDVAEQEQPVHAEVLGFSFPKKWW